MDENMDTSFEEFFDSYDDGGNHTDTEEALEAEETTQVENPTNDSEAAESPESEEKSEQENTEQAEETPAEGQAEPESEEEKRSFDNIKVNGEIISVSYDDAPAWIQKGMDYDRVKGKLEEERAASEQLRQQIGQHQQAIDVLELIASDTGMKMDELLHGLHKSYRMQKGESEKEAEANIRAAKAEREASTYRAQKDQQKNAEQEKQNRMQREYAEFRAANPGINLDDKLVEKLKPDVAAGMTLLGAYQKMQNQQQAAEIAELKKQLEAEKQNKKNMATSPGSQKDSGGQRKRDSYDDFFAAFGE